MKYNEAIYRSPKWLRNFVDYEINTGDDIKGQPSKRKLKRLEKERLEKELLRWDQRWRDADEYTFRRFFKETYNFDIRSNDVLMTVKKQFRGDFNLWEMYDAFLKNEKREQEEQERLSRELDRLYDEVRADFMKAPYSDKIKTPKINGRNAFHYEMENGYTFKIEDNRISYKDKIYTVGLLYRSKFVNLANMMIDNQKRRPGGDKKKATGSGGSSYNSGKSYTNSQRKTRPSWADHPKAETYFSLEKSIELRKEQLSKMKDGPDKAALENELKTAEIMLQKMKDKYKFEHLQSYEIFTKV